MDLFGQCKNEFIDSSAVVKVIKVVDGDTFKFMIKNEVVTVRILNIDSYETKHNERLKRQALKNNIPIDSAFTLGIKAKLTADSLLMDQNVTIVRDYKEKNIDNYGRLLRFVFVDGINYSDYLTSIGLNSNEKE